MKEQYLSRYLMVVERNMAVTFQATVQQMQQSTWLQITSRKTLHSVYTAKLHTEILCKVTGTFEFVYIRSLASIGRSRGL